MAKGSGSSSGSEGWTPPPPPMGDGVSGGPDDVQTAWRLLAGGAPTAANALVGIAKYGRSEVARVQASTAILDRVGLAPPKEVHHRVVPVEFDSKGDVQQLSPAEVIRNRLAELKGPTQALVSGAEHAAEMAMADALMDGITDDEIHEAELVEDDGGWT